MSMLNETLMLGAVGETGPRTFIASESARNSGSTVTVNKPAGAQAGDFVVGIAQILSTSATVSLAGWTQRSVGGFTNNSVQIIYRRLNGSEGSTFAFTISSGTVASLVHLLNYRNIVNGISADNLAAASFATADPQVAASMSVTLDRILLAGLHVNTATGTLTSGPSGMTSRSSVFTGVAPRGAVFDLVNPSTGASGTKSFDISSSLFGGAFLIELD